MVSWKSVFIEWLFNRHYTKKMWWIFFIKFSFSTLDLIIKGSWELSFSWPWNLQYSKIISDKKKSVTADSYDCLMLLVFYVLEWNLLAPTRCYSCSRGSELNVFLYVWINKICLKMIWQSNDSIRIQPNNKSKYLLK